jgi:amino acid permease
LKDEEHKLDNVITQLKEEFEKMTKEDDFKKYGYITHNDLKNMIAEKSMNIIAITAPVGTSLEVPDHNAIQKAYENTKLVNYNLLFIIHFNLEYG